MTDFVLGACPINHPQCPCSTATGPQRNPLRALSVLLDRVRSVRLARRTEADATIKLHVEVVCRNGTELHLDHAVDARAVRAMHGDPLALVLGEVLEQLQEDVT